MPTPPKADPILLYRMEQLENDHVSSSEFKALVEEFREFKKSVLSGIKWIIGLLATGLLTVISGIILAYLTRGI